jgi:hypothetical protein
VLGAPHGIKVNAWAPTAYTRLIGNPEIRKQVGIPQVGEAAKEGRGEPEAVVPLAIFLVHESVPSTGEIFTCTGTNVGRLFIGATRGYTAPALTLESIGDNWETVLDETDYFVPAKTADHALMRNELSL